MVHHQTPKQAIISPAVRICRSYLSRHVITCDLQPGPSCGNIRAPLAFLCCSTRSLFLSICVYRQSPSLGFFHCTIGFLCDIIRARVGNVCTRSNMNALSGLQPHREQFLLQKFSHSGVCRCREAVFPLAGITNTIYHIIFDGAQPRSTYHERTDYTVT